MKKWISLALSMLLLAAAAGCKPAEESAGPDTAAVMMASGRYVESEIDLPLPAGASGQMVLGTAESEAGLAVFTASYFGGQDEGYFRYFRHTLSADGTVSTADENWLNELAPQGGNEMHLLDAGNGALYMSFSDYDEKGNARAHLLVSRSFGESGAALAGDGPTSLGTMTSFGLLKGGSIAAANFYEGRLLLMDSDGNRIGELEAGSRGRISGCAAGGTFVAFAVQGGNVVRVYNTADQSYTDYDYRIPEQSMPQLAVAADGTVYLADNTGLYRHAYGGTIWEKLVDGATSTLGLPDFYAAGLTATADSPYATFYIHDGNTLLRYQYDAAAVAAADKELRVFALSDNDTVRQAIVAFNRVRGDVAVSFTVAMAGASGGTQQDYIKALNTELLAGTGPDILILDGLPIDSYIEKDVLAELTDIVAGSEPVLENVRAAFVRDGGLYAMPTGFKLPIAVTQPGREAAYSDIAALADAAERAGDVPLLSSCAFSYRTLAYYLLKYYGGALETGDAAVIRAFLTDAGRIAGATGCTERMGEGWDILKDIPQEELYADFKAHIAAPQLVMALSGLAQDVLTQPLGSVAGGMEPLAYADHAGAAVTDIGGRFVPVGIVGVNKASAEPEAAAAFVRMLLSHAAQSGKVFAEQFPVNAQALAEHLAYETDGFSSGYMLPDGSEFTSTYPAKVWRDRLGALIASLDTPILEDAALFDMLLPELTACLDGSNSVEQAAERIGSLLSTYLSE